MSDDGHPVGGTVSFSVAAGGQPWPASICWNFAAIASRFGRRDFVSRSASSSPSVVRCFTPGLDRNEILAAGVDHRCSGHRSARRGCRYGGPDSRRSRRGLHRCSLGRLWWTVSRTVYGRAAWFTAAGMLCSLGVSISRLRSIQQAFRCSDLSLPCLGFVVVGHASQARPELLVYPGMFLHVTGMLVWFGALLPLGAALLVDRAAVGQEALDHLSRPLLFIALMMPATGFLLAFVQLQNVAELWGSAYGLGPSSKLPSCFLCSVSLRQIVLY